jgi:competence protein ComEC
VGRVEWRFGALGGVTVGLALSPLVDAPGDLGLAPPLAAAILGLAAFRPRRAGATTWLCLVALTGACAGLIAGAERLAAIDRGALVAPAGQRLEVTAIVNGVPRRANGQVRVRVANRYGRLLLEAHEPVADLRIGDEVRAAGVLAEPPSWYVAYLRRYGIERVLNAQRIEPTGQRRGGPAGVVDGVRRRAEAALGRSVPENEAALARGFVLGQDDRIDAATVEDFKRSGLAHLLAVSGENVLLLALLAQPVLAALGLPLRSRLACLLGLIALYVLVTGAGPSIQRAGVMGAAGVLAAYAGRPRSRAYAVLLAAFATLALNPRASGDPGWQLSFAAVLGIIVWVSPLRELLGRSRTGAARGALLDGAAVTIAATLATAPLMAHDFEAVPAASLPANLLALPAVAPAMWLGMISAGLGQLPSFPVEPVNWLNSLLLAHIAQTARWCAAPNWALVPVRLESWPAVGGGYALIAIGVWTCAAWARRHRELDAHLRHRLRRGVRSRLALIASAIGCLALATGSLPGKQPGVAASRPGLRIEFLDVGQGDAILLQPADGGAVLVDGGPRDDGLRGKLADAGVGELLAAVVTHDQSDHAGGVEDVLGRMPISTLLYGAPSRQLLGFAGAAGVQAMQVAEGSEIRSGSLRLEVLWPPRDERPSPDADPNLHALVLLARWHDFSALLTADAEAEAVPIDPGPVDVLKVAHHGSVDEGLDALLDQTAPRLAVISVGEHNSYGHPTPETLATLDRHHVPTLRTDDDGTIEIDVSGAGWRVHGG